MIRFRIPGRDGVMVAALTGALPGPGAGAIPAAVAPVVVPLRRGLGGRPGLARPQPRPPSWPEHPPLRRHR
jgi:hypothetical protein